LNTLNALNEGLDEVITTATSMGDASMDLYDKNQQVAKTLVHLATQLKAHTGYFSVQ